MRGTLAEIADRSRFLTERLPNPPPNARQRIGDRANWILEQWLDSCSAGNRSHFLKRLSRQGLDLDTWHAVLSTGQVASADFPDWARVLESVLQPSFFRQPGQSDEPGDFSPFTPLLRPFISWAEQCLQQLAETGIAWLTPHAHRDLANALTETLSILSSRTFVLELNSARLLGQLTGRTPQERFQSFLHRQADGPEPMLRLFLEYPVLARLIGTAIARWLRSCSTFLERLQRDREALSHTFNDGRPLGAVEGIACASDPHRGGNSVMILRFADGPKLVYKPKDLRIEAAFQEFLEWLNRQSPPLSLRTTKVLTCDGYGYVEYVEHRHCETMDQLTRFFRRAGMQLCLLYVFQATDFHYENVIACGEHPVLVDLESLFHPELRKEERAGSGSDADAVAVDIVSNSVIRTGMLPNARLGDKGMPGYDVSALGGRPGQWYPRLLPVWLNAGTDEMRIDLEYATLEPRANLPVSTGVVLPLRDFAGDVVAGFGELYEFLIRHRDQIRTDCAPFERMASLPTRFIVRPTQTYFDVLWKSFDPQYLRDGLQYSICSEILWRAAKQEKIWDLVEEEIQQIQCLDIPYFSIRPNGTRIEAGDGILIEGLIKEPSWNAAVFRLKRMDLMDKRAQESIIRASLDIDWHATPRPSASTVADQDPRGTPQSLDFTAVAVEIAEEICRGAISSPDGSITWVGPEYAADYDQYRLQPLSPVLYGGKAGIAMFLAAVYDLTGASVFRDQAFAALRTVLRLLREWKPERLVQQLGIGGLSGVGSLIYSMVRCGVHLRDEQLLDEAEMLATQIDMSLVAQDDVYDVVGGTAGWILALLALNRQRPNGPALERAFDSAAHLIGCFDGPGPARRGQPQRRRFGFAHGYAGIGYAFLQLAVVSEIRKYREAEERAARHESLERAALDAEGIRSSSHSREWEEFLGSWCYGYTGLALAAVRGYSSLETGLSDAVAAVAQLPLAPSDHLCCGNAGRIDALFESERISPAVSPCGAALQLVQHMYARRMRNGLWSLMPMGIPGIGNHSLFRGTAGIGYEFLRLADPERIPSLLVLG